MSKRSFCTYEQDRINIQFGTDNCFSSGCDCVPDIDSDELEGFCTLGLDCEDDACDFGEDCEDIMTYEN